MTARVVQNFHFKVVTRHFYIHFVHDDCCDQILYVEPLHAADSRVQHIMYTNACSDRVSFATTADIATYLLGSKDCSRLMIRLMIA